MAQTPEQYVSQNIQTRDQAKILKNHATTGTPAAQRFAGQPGKLLLFTIFVMTHHAAVG